MKRFFFILGVLLLVVSSASSFAQVPQPQVSEPVKLDLPPNPPGTGFVPPAIDLSHFDADQAMMRRAVTPPTWDWRNPGAPHVGNKVTSVKNQLSCGACYSFAYLGCLEGRILVDGGAPFDLSENHAKECYYTDPNCAGGNAYQMACLLSQTGTQLESDNSYVAFNDSCYTGAPYPYQQSVTDWQSISGATIPSVNTLKNYIMTNGPVYTTLYVGTSGPPSPWYYEFGGYDGTFGLCNRTEAGTINHAVLIVGWDDTQSWDAFPHDGNPDGVGCWIVKNSWGTSWGGTCGFGAESGYFYIDYQSADIGQWSSYVDGWQTYDTNGGMLYFDEAGWGNIAWGYGTTTCWALCRYAVGSDTKAQAIEFWTNDLTTDVDVYLYDSFNTGTLALGTKLTETLNSSFPEPGYHSVSITPTDIGPSSNPEAVAVVKITNNSYGFPIPADWGNGSPPLETNRCYISSNGANGTWGQTSNNPTYPSDLGVRIRTSTSTDVQDWSQF